MGEIKFNENQMKAIEHKDSSLMVSAAAGSGKTKVLVERIIRKIVKENVDIDKLLIVTFTNAAASGMRQKIKSAIRDCLKKDKDNSNLKRQLLLVDRANISTVHSFCLDLIKKYSHLLSEDVPSKFSLINETEKQLMINQILSEMISEYYENSDEEFIMLSETYGAINNDSKLIDLIVTVYNFLISIPDYKEWVKKSLYKISGEDDFYNSIYAKSLNKFIKNTFLSCIEKYSFIISLVKDNPDMQVYYDFFKEESLYFKRVLECDDLKETLELVNNIEFKRLPTVKNSIYLELIKQVRDKVKKHIIKINETYSQKIIEINLKNTKDYDIINKLFKVVLLFDEKFKQEKYQSGYLDFNDLEHLTIELLCDNGCLREEFIPLRDSFNEILVDEYQDTNDVQERIFTLLKKDNNLFTVGDIKQSIYRFRNANPNLFLRRIKEYRDNNSGEVVNLNLNYRCHPNVVDTVNMIFSFLMSKDISGIDYDKEEKLICGGDFSKNSSHHFSTEIKLAINERLGEEEGFKKEAAVIALTIKKMVSDKDFLIDNKRVSYKDITILTRSFNEKTLALLKELSAYGIPVSYEDKTQFFNTVEIKSFVSLLKIIDNPYDDISYIGALRNIFLYTDDELLKLRVIDKKASFYELLKASENEKDKNTHSYIESLRDYSKRYDLKSLIKKIYDDTFYVEMQTRYPNGSKRKENLERLIDIAKDYEDDEYKGIYSFVTYIDRIISQNTKILNPKISDNQDTVKVMSIHSSKGLEFNVVILQGIDKKFNRMDFNLDIILSSSLGVGYSSVNNEIGYKYPSIYKNIITEEEKSELLLEESRILYVALTRAKYKLILTGCVKKSSKEEWYTSYLNTGLVNKDSISYIDFKGLGSYLDMILPPLLKHKNNEVDSDICDDELFNIASGKIKIYVYDDIPDIKGVDKGEIKLIKEELSNEQKEEFTDKYEYKYLNEFLNIPEKISVTEARKIMAKEEDVFEAGMTDEIYVPDFRGENKITAKERGILIHYIFENINLNLLKNSDNKMKVILDFIEDNEYIKDKLTHSDLKKIQGFFDSYIGIKMLRAKEVHREKEFLLREDIKEIYKDQNKDFKGRKMIIQGIIDCYFEDTKGDIYLIDYKYTLGGIEKIKEEYAFQLKMYKLALSKSLGIDISQIKSYVWDVNNMREIKM